MPILNVTTKASREVWKSPDGQRKIYELQLEYEGQPVMAKTYSDQIATVGWKGTVDTYEKPGRNGIETFVKQPPKEGGFSQSSAGSSAPGRGNSYQPKDDKAIQAMWAIDKAKDIVIAVGVDAKHPLDDVEANIEEWGQRLFAMVDRVKASEDAPEAPDEIHTVTDEPLDLSLIDKVFNTEPEAEEESPWPKPQS